MSTHLPLNAPAISVLQVLQGLPAGHRTTGLDIGVLARLGPGTVRPTLARLERLGWVESHWEERDPADGDRARRRLYQLSQDGLQIARQSLRDAELRHNAWTMRLPARGVA